ncbi:MAG: class I SAM-dependent methyltransferase [Enhygromyxa sp.]
MIHLTVLAVAITVAVVTQQWFWALLIPVGFFLTTEVLYFAAGLEVYRHANRVRRAYEWFDIYLDGAYGEGRDLTEAFFDGDRSKPYDQALVDKFDHFIELLGLRPGQRLLDVGCGYGDFITHAQKRGIVARGISLSQHHATVCRKRGLDVLLADARNMPVELYGQFDAVTFMGCLEHFGTYVTLRDRSIHDALLQRTFASAYRLLSPTSPVRRVLTSTIHETKLNPKGIDWLHGYLIERHYSGLYPRGDEGLVKNARPWFEEISRRDATEDYRLASELDPVHFGSFSIRWTTRRVVFVPLLFLLDPFALHKWLYHGLGSWMWQFGGVGGLPESERPVTLWWFVLQGRPSHEVPAHDTVGAPHD